MIIGLGSDLIDIRRIEKTLERFGQRFIDRIFTDVEQMKSERRAERVASYAKRFAAKEACAKALGTGLKHGVFWRDMGVVNLPSGQPTMKLTGGAAEAARSDHAQGNGSPDRSDHHRRVSGGPGRGHYQRCNQTVAVNRGICQVRLRVQVRGLDAGGPLGFPPELT